MASLDQRCMVTDDLVLERNKITCAFGFWMTLFSLRNSTSLWLPPTHFGLVRNIFPIISSEVSIHQAQEIISRKLFHFLAAPCFLKSKW